MTMTSRRPLLLGALALACIAALGVGYFVGGARAAGDHTSGTLTYRGFMMDESSGVPTNGPKDITLKLWAGDPKTTGYVVCTTVAKATEVVKGHFEVNLHPNCTVAVHTYGSTWIEVLVGTNSLGNTKLGSAPYAVHAAGYQEKSCPDRYIQDASAKTITLCRRGNDEVVRVGDYWIDRFEASVVASATHAGKGTCGGTWTQYGTGGDNYANANLPDTGGWTTTKSFACSVPGKKASSWLTWFQAQQVCLLAGKRLCTNAEWQQAAAGTPDDGSCNTNSPSTGVVVSSAASKCVSRWGAVNMNGNLWEWVAEWRQAGRPDPKFTNGNAGYTWPGTAYGGDVTYNVNGRAYAGSGFVYGLPVAMRRGGAYLNQSASGVYASTWVNPPSYGTVTSGVRCCLD